MEEIIELLLYKLSDKGLTPIEIRRLIRDVLNIAGDGGDFTAGTITGKLESLGWDGNIVDPFTFELIVALLENGDEYEVEVTTLH
jgi:hypothetical protein